MALRGPGIPSNGMPRSRPRTSWPNEADGSTARLLARRTSVLATRMVSISKNGGSSLLVADRMQTVGEVGVCLAGVGAMLTGWTRLAFLFLAHAGRAPGHPRLSRRGIRPLCRL